MPWHHIIPRHEWKRRFRNLVGFNAPDNKVNLSHENHTEIHLRYAEEGSKPDMVAALAMSGKLLPEDIQRELSYLSGLSGGRPKGFHHTQEWKDNNSRLMKGNKYLLGHVPSEHQKEKQRLSMLGNQHLLGHKHSENSRQKIAETLKNLPRLICLYCGKIGGPANMKRYHFENCKVGLGCVGV